MSATQLPSQISNPSSPLPSTEIVSADGAASVAALTVSTFSANGSIRTITVVNTLTITTDTNNTPQSSASSPSATTSSISGPQSPKALLLAILIPIIIVPFAIVLGYWVFRRRKYQKHIAEAQQRREHKPEVQQFPPHNNDDFVPETSYNNAEMYPHPRDPLDKSEVVVLSIPGRRYEDPSPVPGRRYGDS